MAQVSDFDPRRESRHFRSSVRVDSRGFAVTETVIALALLATVILSGLAMTYFAISVVWIEKSTYEASICAASRGEIQHCRNQLRRSVEGALPIGNIEALSVERFENLVRSRLRLRLHSSLEPIDHRDERRLPLLEPVPPAKTRRRRR